LRYQWLPRPLSLGVELNRCAVVCGFAVLASVLELGFIS
jgi:hypothetical protein